MVQAMVKSQGMDAGERLLIQRDRRADGGARHVRVTRGTILIARRFGGIEMLIAAPVKAYRGVGLARLTDLQGDVLHRLVLAHQDPDLDIVLSETRDSVQAQEAQEAWARWFDLSQLAMQDGEWMNVNGIVDEPSPVMCPRPTLTDRRRPSARAGRRTVELRPNTGISAQGRESLVVNERLSP